MAYFVGSKIHIRNLRLFRGPTGQRTLDWAEHALIHRGAAFIIAARFIPFGRVAVNLTAGALKFNRRRFMIIDAIAVAIWATYGVRIGITARRDLRQPAGVDRCGRRWRHRAWLAHRPDPRLGLASRCPTLTRSPSAGEC